LPKPLVHLPERRSDYMSQVQLVNYLPSRRCVETRVGARKWFALDLTGAARLPKIDQAWSPSGQPTGECVKS